MAFRKSLVGTTLLALVQFFSNVPVANGDNPIIQTIYTADPAPLVYNGRVYLFTSHDQDYAGSFYEMIDWALFSSADMVNWQHHAPPASLQTFPWANRDAWAGQVVPRNGKFYYYVPVSNRTGGDWSTFAIGVGVSDNIEGPYKGKCEGQRASRVS